MGPTLTSRLLDLNDVQDGVLNIAFHVADTQKLLLLDLKDLQAALKYVAENASAIGQEFGNVAPATVGTIQRKLLALETQGAANFFGEPALKLTDLMKTDSDGKGYVNILAADTLIQSPRLYSTFLLWLLSELFEELPEVGDPDKPKLVFFFDEAHLLFNDAPKSLMEKIEQVVRLIRSKGVGVYFVTQNPADIPDTVLAQLGNRVQHALRAYTPAEQKGLKAASDSFRPNPAFDTATTIQGLEVGQALVSVLDEKGAPTVVAKTLIRPPASRLGPITPQERSDIMATSPVAGVYDQTLDRESAFETLHNRAAAAQEQAQAHAQVDAAEQQAHDQYNPPAARAPAAKPSQTVSMLEAFGKSALRAIGSSAGRQITNALVRGILGGMSRR